METFETLGLDLITPAILNNLGFVEVDKITFVKSGNSIPSLKLIKHSDVTNWMVIYNNNELPITWYSPDKLECLLTGLGL